MKESTKWGLYSFYIFLVLSFLGIVNYIFMKVIADPDFFEGMMFAFFNITWLIYVFGANFLEFLSQNITFFIVSWIIGGAIWFLIGMLLGWLVRNQQTTEEKLKSVGKKIMFFALGIIGLFILVTFFLIIISSWDLMGLMWFLAIFGVMLILPLVGGIFFIGLILWLMSKYGFRRTIKWVIILIIIALILFGGGKFLEWIVRNTEYFKFLR